MAEFTIRFTISRNNDFALVGSADSCCLLAAMTPEVPR